MAKQTPYHRPERQRSEGNVSLARGLSKLGFASRSLAGALITSGRVRVNDRVVKDPSQWIDLRTDRIVVEGVDRPMTKDRALMLHKPAGVVTTTSDERGRKTVFDVLGSAGKGLKTVGRLDLQTTGMLLFVTDNRLADALTDPRNACEKIYHVRIDENLSLEMEEQIQRGLLIELEGARHKTRPSSIKKLGPRFYEISITEGKNRQVRRMIEAVGREVISLHRISVAGLRLDVELPGAWRDLTQLELASLRAQIQERKPQSRASDRFKHR